MFHKSDVAILYSGHFMSKNVPKNDGLIQFVERHTSKVPSMYGVQMIVPFVLFRNCALKFLSKFSKIHNFP